MWRFVGGEDKATGGVGDGPLSPRKTPLSYNPVPPVTRAAPSVGYSNDFQTRSRLSKYDEIRKPLEYQPTSAKCVFREPPWVVSNSLDGAVKLIEEHSCRPRTAPSIPFSGGFSFVQSGRVNSNGYAAHCSCRDRQQRRASSHGISRTA